MSETAIEPMTFDHAGLSVSDIPKARTFYADVMGFTTVGAYHELDDLGIKIQIVLNPSGVRLELFEHAHSAQAPERRGHPSEDARVRGWFQLGLLVADVQKTYDRVVGAGARAVMSPRVAPDGKTWMAFVADPDDNLIEFIERRPG